MPRFVAFLRGINVGGHNLVPMARLRSMFEELGFEKVQTLLQSGNVLFSGSAAAAKESNLERAFAERCGFSADFIVRSSLEIDKVVKSNPFPSLAKSDPGRLLVMFLKQRVTPSQFSAFSKGLAGPEIVKSKGTELFIYYPNGVGRSKLKIPFNGTARNWNTVLKLHALLRTG